MSRGLPTKRSRSARIDFWAMNVFAVVLIAAAGYLLLNGQFTIPHRRGGGFNLFEGGSLFLMACAPGLLGLALMLIAQDVRTDDSQGRGSAREARDACDEAPTLMFDEHDVDRGCDEWTKRRAQAERGQGRTNDALAQLLIVASVGCLLASIAFATPIYPGMGSRA